MTHRRSWAGVARIASVLLLFLLRVGPVPAKDSVAGLIERAKAAGKDPAKAGSLFGQAVAAAQKARDLQSEQAAADALEAWMDGLEPDASPTPSEVTHAGRADARTALAAVLRELEPQRNGAFVSAHAIAAELLADAVAIGDGGHVEAAAPVLVARARAPRSGRAARARGEWGGGGGGGGEAGRAGGGAPGGGAGKAFAAEGWLGPAAWAATELAALRWKAKEAGMAAAALALATRLLGETSDKVVVQEWIRAVRARLEGIPDAALADFRKATGPFDGAASDGTAGGDAGAGGDGVSDVGRYLLKASPSEPFVTVTRARIDYEIRLAFDPSGRPNRPFTWGQDHWNQGGVTLAFAGSAVALRMVDLAGTRSQPSQRHRASRVRAFYLLAPDETWGVTKGGAVTVVGP